MPSKDHNPTADASVDATGHQCPVPLLMTKQAASQLAPGQVLHIVSTDLHTGLDLAAWCARFGHRLLMEKVREDHQEYWLIIGQKQPRTQRITGR